MANGENRFKRVFKSSVFDRFILGRMAWSKTHAHRNECASMSAQSQESDILQQLDGVECEIAEARKQAVYRNRLKDTCLLQGYCDGKFSMILNLDAFLEVNNVAPINAPCGHRTTSVQFTVCISHRDSTDVPCRVKSEKEDMLVRDVDIVKCPSGRIVPSLVRLNLRHDAVEERFASGIYLNPVKGTLDFLSCFPNWELGSVGKLVRETSADCGVPREVHSGSQIVESITGDQGQVIQGVCEVGDFMFQRLSAVWALLDCHSASIFERDNSGVHVRDMFLGPLHLESSIPIKCTHAESLR